jgi:hypothetical protein
MALPGARVSRRLSTSIILCIIEEKKQIPTENDSSGAAAIERGKKAIAADEHINKKDADPAKKKEEGAKDAQNWRNEG